MFLVRFQAWPLRLNILLLPNDPCPARSGIKAVGESGVGGPFFASPSFIPVLLVDHGCDNELYGCFGIVVRKRFRPKSRSYQQKDEKGLTQLRLDYIDNSLTQHTPPKIDNLSLHTRTLCPLYKTLCIPSKVHYPTTSNPQPFHTTPTPLPRNRRP